MKNNIECSRARQLLAGDYMDEALDRESRGQVDLHLAQCSACRQDAERLAAVARALRQARKMNAPPEVWARIKAKVSREHARHSGFRTRPAGNILHIFMMRPAFAAAAAAVLIVAAAALFMQAPGPSGNGPGAVSGATAAVDLNALTGNIELLDQHSGFGSSIELLLM